MRLLNQHANEASVALPHRKRAIVACLKAIGTDSDKGSVCQTKPTSTARVPDKIHGFVPRPNPHQTWYMRRHQKSIPPPPTNHFISSPLYLCICLPLPLQC